MEQSPARQQQSTNSEKGHFINPFPFSTLQAPPTPLLRGSWGDPAWPWTGSNWRDGDLHIAIAQIIATDLIDPTNELQIVVVLLYPESSIPNSSEHIISVHNDLLRDYNFRVIQKYQLLLQRHALVTEGQIHQPILKAKASFLWRYQ